MRQIFIVFVFLIVLPIKAENPNWGKTGHRTIADIASLYLKGKTKRKIAKLLEGQSIVFVSTFADDVKSDKNYNKYYSWHYINKSFDKTYEEAEKNTKGDLVTGINKCIAVLKDKTSNNEAKEFHLKMLVHLIGDLHQPLHVGKKEDKGANGFQVQWYGKGTNLHSVWDSKMLDSYNMTYSELTKNIPEFSKEQIKVLKQGSIIDWANETGKLADKVYSSAKSGENLSYKYMYDNFYLIEKQLQKGGIRLAKVLNDIFS